MFIFLITYDRDLKTLPALLLMIRLEKGPILNRPPSYSCCFFNLSRPQLSSFFFVSPNPTSEASPRYAFSPVPFRKGMSKQPAEPSAAQSQGVEFVNDFMNHPDL